MAESIYIHIPFCKSKCPYCDFASWANKEYLIEEYFNALICEVKTKCQAYKDFNANKSNKPIKTIFIGGGTPSLIAPKYYDELFSELKNFFTIDLNPEITLELNPGTAKLDYLIGYKKLGINRISIGAQSFNEDVLNTLGRKHDIQETIFAVEKTKEAGFDNFNLDLIYAVPGLSDQLWKDSIKKALSFNPNHISAYSLIIEPNTPFEEIYKDKTKLPTDDRSYEMYSMLCNTLKEEGFNHYEISNFAKPGFESKHNLTYWGAKEFYAFGLSSHRLLNGMRTHNLKTIDSYINAPNHETVIDFPIDLDFEKIMLNSRLNKGFEISLIEKVSKKDCAEIKSLLKEMSNEGYIELTHNKVLLTDKGMFLNNEILLQLM